MRTLPIAARMIVIGIAASGAGALVLGAILTAEQGFGSVPVLVGVTMALTLSMSAPMYLLRGDEAEDVEVDEAFLVVLLLMFPPLSALVAFAVATLATNVIRPRSVAKIAFNVGQMTLSTSLATLVGAAAGINDPGTVLAGELFAATAAAATFFLVNQAAMTAILVTTDAATLRDRLHEIWSSTLLASSASTAMGLLAALAGAAHEWALAIGLAPLAVLRVVLGRVFHVQHERDRIDSLLRATTNIHRSVRFSEVSGAITTVAEELVRARRCEILDRPPRDGEIGVSLAGERECWLIASDPKGVRREEFTLEDQRTLEALVTLSTDAFNNARLVEEIHHRAFHDELTGLANRVLFEERLEYVLQQTQRSSRCVGVLFVDLDRFKKINDSLGHEAGNALLIAVAERLNGAVRPGDVVARNGGDEFTVLLAGMTSGRDAVYVAERILDSMTAPFHLGNHAVYVSASIGIATHPPDGTDAATLIKKADMAMYRAKERGRNTFHIFTPGLAQTGADRLTLESELHAAVHSGGLSIAYQPQVDLATGRIVGVEALVRWDHPTLGQVSPGRFIPLAEDTGLIRDIDRQVLRRACQQLREWMDAGMAPIKVAVNLSGHDVQEPHFVDRVAEILAATGVPPQHLELEITESVAMDHADHGVFHELKDLGCRLAIDDFGTGYSMLSRLQQFPLDKLKVDKSFIDEIRGSVDEAPIVAALVNMGHGLGLEVCAEGVETQDQWDFLDRLRCDLVQGYYVSRPVAPEKLFAFASAREDMDIDLR